jgi:hypothetical protein
MLKLHAGQFTIDAAAGDAPRRTISGIAVRYNTEAIVSDGTRVMFAPGSLPSDGPSPKLFMYHDATKVIGTVTARVETPEGMLFSAKVAETNLGSEALVLAAAGALSDVSVGVEPTKFKYDKNGVMVISASKWMELSVVPHGAFDAPILDVAASIHQDEEEISNTEEVIPETETPMSEQVEAPAVVEAATITQTLFAQPRKEFAMPSAAEYISAVMRGDGQEMHAKIRAAAPDVVTSDLDGILPLPIVQPVYNNFRGLRPLIDAMQPKAMPQGGKIFIRPKVTTHTSIGGPQTQNQTITAGTFVVSDEQVTKQIFGGYVDVSEASMDWSQPEVLSLMLDDMARIYANQTDAYACAEFEDGVSQTATLTDASSAADWASFVYEAATEILVNSNGNLPNALIVSPEYFQALGTLTDDAGRPLFPQVGPMNAFGSMNPASVNASAFGLQLVVDRNLSAQVYVGNTEGFEVFEQQKGAISIDNPSQLSRTIAFRGYLATLMIDATKFVKRGA